MGCNIGSAVRTSYMMQLRQPFPRVKITKYFLQCVSSTSCPVVIFCMHSNMHIAIITVLHIMELLSETRVAVQKGIFEIVGCVVHMLCFSPLVLCFHYTFADGEHL